MYKTKASPIMSASEPSLIIDLKCSENIRFGHEKTADILLATQIFSINGFFRFKIPWGWRLPDQIRQLGKPSNGGTYAC